MTSHIREERAEEERKKKAIKVKCTQHAIKPLNDHNLSVFRFTAISNKIRHGCEAVLELLECRSGLKLTGTQTCSICFTCSGRPTHTDGQVIDPALSLVSHHRVGVRKEGGRPVESGVARFLRKKKTIAANRTFNHRFSNAFRPGGCGS